VTIWLTVKQEAFAQAMARGASPQRAHEEAGYKSHGNAARMAEDKKIAGRVREIKRGRAAGDSRDVGPIINDLVAAAKKAIKLNTASGFIAARGLLAEAARQKMRVAAEPAPFERQLAIAQWDKKRGGKT
jgi:hypothetical protein